MHIEIESLVAAPPAAVFAVTTDIARWPGVISAIQHIDVLTPGPVGIGTRFRETRMMLGRKATEEMTVTELVPPERFVLTAFNHGTRYRAEHLFRAVAGGTQLRLVFVGVPETLAARLLTPLGWLMRGTVMRQLEADFADLKRAAEAGMRT